MSIARGMLEHGVSKLAPIDLDVREGARAAVILRQEFLGNDEDIVFKDADVTQSEQISRVVGDLAEAFGKIDVLAGFAGIVSAIRALDYSPEAFRRICDVNITGTFLTAQAVGR